MVSLIDFLHRSVVDCEIISLMMFQVDRYVYFSGSHLCLRNSLKMAIRFCHFSQYLGTKFEMLFEIAKSVEIVIILGKKVILP